MRERERGTARRLLGGEAANREKSGTNRNNQNEMYIIQRLVAMKKIGGHINGYRRPASEEDEDANISETDQVN